MHYSYSCEAIILWLQAAELSNLSFPASQPLYLDVSRAISDYHSHIAKLVIIMSSSLPSRAKPQSDIFSFFLTIQLKGSLKNRSERLSVAETDSIAAVKAQVMKRYSSDQDALLSFDGIQLKDDRSLADYSIQRGASLDLQFPPIAGKMQIIVEMWAGETIVLHASPADTVEMLKAQIQRLKDISVARQLLLFDTTRLENRRTLASYSIGDESMLHLRVGMQGGFRFNPVVFSPLERKTELDLDSTAPNYRTVNQGLNFETVCINTACSAYQCNVIVCKGFGLFDIAYESSTLKCPLCHKKTQQSLACGFYMAKWEIDGKLESGEVKTNSDQTEKYAMFMEGGNAKWIYLRITVESLGSSCVLS